MNYLFLVSSLLLSAVSFSQIHQKGTNSETEKVINIRLDSLSKVYHVQVVNYTKKSQNGIRTKTIGYNKNGKLVDKVIEIDTLIILPKK